MSTETHNPHHDLNASFNNFAKTSSGHTVLDYAVKNIQDMEAFTQKIRPFFLTYLQIKDDAIYENYSSDEYIEAKGGDDFIFDVDFEIGAVFFEHVKPSNTSSEKREDNANIEKPSKGAPLKWVVLAVAIPVAAYCAMKYIS